MPYTQNHITESLCKIRRGGVTILAKQRYLSNTGKSNKVGYEAHDQEN